MSSIGSDGLVVESLDDQVQRVEVEVAGWNNVNQEGRLLLRNGT
jgi:hypothetical protein